MHFRRSDWSKYVDSVCHTSVSFCHRKNQQNMDLLSTTNKSQSQGQLLWEKSYLSKSLVSFQSIVNYSYWSACHFFLSIILCECFHIWQHAESYSTKLDKQIRCDGVKLENFTQFLFSQVISIVNLFNYVCCFWPCLCVCVHFRPSCFPVLFHTRPPLPVSFLQYESWNNLMLFNSSHNGRSTMWLFRMTTWPLPLPKGKEKTWMNGDECSVHLYTHTFTHTQ